MFAQVGVLTDCYRMGGVHHVTAAAAWIAQVGVLTDVTGRRNSLDAMRLCDRALASTSEAIVITDPNQNDNPIIYCNRGFERLTGGLPSASLPLSCWMYYFLHPSFPLPHPPSLVGCIIFFLPSVFCINLHLPQLTV